MVELLMNALKNKNDLHEISPQGSDKSPSFVDVAIFIKHFIWSKFEENKVMKHKITKT